MQILDGTGKGYRAKVTNCGKLEVCSVVETNESYLSGNFGRAFSISTLVQTLNSTNEHYVMWMKNQSQNYDMRIWVANFAWNGGSTNHNRVMKWSWYVGSGEPTANHTAAISGNLNLSSNNDSEVTTYKWDGVGDGMTMGSAGIKTTEELFSQGHSIIEARGIPVIGYNDVIAFSITGEEVGDFVITVRYFMTDRIGV